MNYMEKVADMLGVEINEEFKIEGYGNNLKFKFTENRFLQSYDYVYEWVDSVSIMNVLEGRAKIIKIPKPILTDEEKAYLSDVIRPFRDKVVKFKKIEFWLRTRVYIYLKNDAISTACFDKKTMYTGMKEGKDYTLDELGI